MEQECSETEKGGKGAWQTPTERKGEQEIGKEQVDVEERTPTMQGQRSKGGREFPYKGSNSGKMEQESQKV